MKINSETSIGQLIANGIKLPARPEILVELQQMLSSDNFSMADLSRVISGDPGICAMLFKVSKSPIFGRNKKLDSVEQVLMVIGVKQTYNLVQAIALCGSISTSEKKAYDLFWSRSQEVAQIAALIATERLSVCNIYSDQAYLAGIFQECGVPILMQRFPDYFDRFELGVSNDWPNPVDEDSTYNVDHCSIGYLVARHWNLPDFICQAILHHHELPHEEHGAARTLVAILQLAMHFYHRITHREHQLWWKIRAEVLSELGISLETEQSYYEEISERFLA